MIRRPGQTILEVILAIGVILTSVTGSTTLIISTITASRLSQSKIEATNIAREGVEAVQAVRDSNWLKRDQNIGDDPPPACPSSNCTPSIVAWDDSGSLTDGYAPMGAESDIECGSAQDSISSLERFRAVLTANGWALEEQYQGNKCNNNIPNDLASAFTVYQVPTFLFTQSSTNAIATKYLRIINITKGYERQSGGTFVNDVNCPLVASNVCLEFITIASEVFWHDQTGNDVKYVGQGGLKYNRRVTVEKRLYNWR